MPKTTTRKHAAARSALEKELAALNRKLERLHDPELGNVGHAFREAMSATGATENVDLSLRLSTNGCFSSYLYKRDRSFFGNEILYGRSALKSRERLGSTRRHEFIHALQFLYASALSANFFNKKSNIFICPRDMIHLGSCMEQDAYAKDLWMSDLTPETGKKHPPSLAEFNELCQGKKGRKLQEFMACMAYDLLKIIGRWAPRDPIETVADSYARDTLADYKDGYEWRRKYFPVKNPVFVRIEPQDILAIGRSFGPNFFAYRQMRQDFLRHAPLSSANRRDLERLNKKLGIQDEDALPTFSEALKAQGLTRKKFLKISRDQKPPRGFT